jgi:hypothetical protein
MCWCSRREDGALSGIVLVDGFDPYHNDTQAREALEEWYVKNPAHQSFDIKIYGNTVNYCVHISSGSWFWEVRNKSLSAAITEALCKATGMEV